MKAVDLGELTESGRKFALALARSLGGETLDDVTRIRDLFPEDPETSFVLAGLLTMAGRWPDAIERIAGLLLRQVTDPDLWTFQQIVAAGHIDEALRLLEETEGKELWRPLYEALRAIQAGSRHYLRRVAPEVRPVAEQILSVLAPDLPEPTLKRRPKNKAKRNRL
jgi:hypothetical protein